MTRHQMREIAFILVFESIFINEEADEIIQLASECDSIEVNQDSINIFKGVLENQEEIDLLIKKHLKNWSLDRLSKVGLAILRVSVYEMVIAKSVDIGVAINEAVEIAKKYSTQDDANYINGVLGSISRE